VMLGSHFYNRFSMWRTLVAAIRHALWHDVWTNALHDDRDYCIARMLVWQEMRMRGDADGSWPFPETPFEGRELYALLVMGMLSFILQSMPFSTTTTDDASGEEMEVDGTLEAGEGAEVAGRRWLETYDPLQTFAYAPTPSDVFLDAVRRDMALVAHSILSRFSPSQSQEFLQVWADARSIFIQEYERRCQYNRSL
jgi:hypothetical protein